MKEEMKYCKFCDEEKPIKEFVKSGFAIKNICKKCQNEKQKKIYSDSKKVRLLEAQLKAKEEVIKEFIDYLENEININPYNISDYAYEDIINTILSKYKEIIGDVKNDL